MVVAFISVGANLAPQKNIRAALEILHGETRVAACSTFYRTVPLDERDQPAYINGVWRIETDLPARDVKSRLLSPIERQLGRRRTADKYSPRTIDLDLVLHGDLVIDEPDLKLPHPDILRPFVYFPVIELLSQMSRGYLGDLPRRIRRLLPPMPTAPPGERLPEFTRELRELLD